MHPSIKPYVKDKSKYIVYSFSLDKNGAYLKATSVDSTCFSNKNTTSTCIFNSSHDKEYFPIRIVEKNDLMSLPVGIPWPEPLPWGWVTISGLSHDSLKQQLELKCSFWQLDLALDTVIRKSYKSLRRLRTTFHNVSQRNWYCWGDFCPFRPLIFTER